MRAAFAPKHPPVAASPQPNELDRRRIEKALETRRRYRYVSPRVIAIAEGYRIESPCCSRNVDPQGGIIDVALLIYAPEAPSWHLYRKEHGANQWLLEASFGRLVELLDRLREDPDRRFWQ